MCSSVEKMSWRGYSDKNVLLVQDLLSQRSGSRHCCGRVPAASVGRIGGGAAEGAAVGASPPLALAPAPALASAPAPALSVCFGVTGAERAAVGASPPLALAAAAAWPAVVVGGRMTERAAVGLSPLPALAACDVAWRSPPPPHLPNTPPASPTAERGPPAR